MKAVIPAAGMATRLLPATKSQPKEMLPIVDKPAIQYVVEEAVAAGIRDILVITGRGKRAIEDHFDRAFELEEMLRAKGQEDMLREVRRIAELADMHYIRQREPLGLGHAILQARTHVGDAPFAVLLGDDVVFSDEPCIRQLTRVFQQQGASVIAVEPIPPARSVLYGVPALGKRVSPGLWEITDVVEKPKPRDAPSKLGILGRYVFMPALFGAIERTKPGKSGEYQLADALRVLLEEEKVYALATKGRRYDLGDRTEWLKTNIEVGLMRPDTRKALLPFVRAMARKPPRPLR
ncbi:MAG: UTP--glucose-1-phosphate uridylyltransferase GalU [Halobacteriales archaeon]|nr:UTP--glucose-1-phosphate uridylyltransferase GalU [Halobacteriales archaeon]